MTRLKDHKLQMIILIGSALGCGSQASFSGKSPNSTQVRTIVEESDVTVKLPVIEPANEFSELPAVKKNTKTREVKIVKSFPLNKLEEREVKYQLAGQTISENLLIENDFLTEEKSINQVTRPLVTKEFKQGSQGFFAMESFKQDKIGVLDLLIVIDNSRSMEQEQLNLSKRLGALLTYINDSDWRINIVTTDPKDGCSRAILKKGDSDLAAKFESAVTAGTAGTGFEEGIRMAVEGLSCKSVDWVRPQSSIAVLFVSDEDNCSTNGKDCRNSGFDNSQALLTFLENKLGRVVGKTARAYGIYWEPGTSCTGAESEAIQYHELVTKTGGKYGSICDDDFSPTLRRISADVSELLVTELELKNVPVTSSLKVKLNGQEIQGGFKIERNKIVFEKNPPFGTQIEIAYYHSPSEVLRKFEIGSPIAPDTLQVIVDKRVENKQKYNYDEADNSVTFNEPPRENADIKIEGRKKDPLLNRFNFGNIESKFISTEVFVGGRKINQYEILDIAGELVLELNVPPRDGEKVILKLLIPSGMKNTYPLALIKNPGFTLVEISDFKTGLPVPYKLVDNMISFVSETLELGQRIQVSYLTSIAKSAAIEVADLQALGKLVLADEFIEKCKLDKDVDQLLVLIDCNLPAGTDIRLKWQVPIELNRHIRLEFSQDELSGLDPLDFLRDAKVRFMIDGSVFGGAELKDQEVRLMRVPEGAQSLVIEISRYIEEMDGRSSVLSNASGETL